MTTTAAAEESFLTATQAAWQTATSIEPALGKVSRDQLKEVTDALDEIEATRAAALAEMSDEDAEGAKTTIAMVYMRCAVVAIAAGEEAKAHGWLDIAEKISHDEEQRHEIMAARRHPERYRQLVHGRNLIAHDHARAARKLWHALSKAGANDTLARLAELELNAPRPLTGEPPSLGSLNGFGSSFFGSRDHWEDGSYATTHCVTALWIPVFALGAYRVQADGEGYTVFAREPLSKFAKISRWIFPSLIALSIAGYFANSYLKDPTRLAKQRWDDSYETTKKADAEVALKRLDTLLTGSDFHLVNPQRIQQAGADVVRHAAKLVPSPLTRDNVDQAGRVVRRYQALPEAAKVGVARDAILGVLDAWIKQLAAPELADARLVLLRHAKDFADSRRAGAITTQITETRMAVAKARAAEQPLESFAILMEEPHAEAMKIATEIVTRLVESPSLLVEAGTDLDGWIAQTPQTSELRQRVVAQRELAIAARGESAVEELTIVQLTAMQKLRPWDQWVTVRLAQEEASAGKIDEAGTRLRALGKPGMIIRDGRAMLGQIASAQGNLEEADQILTGLLGGRLERFVAASTKLEEATKRVQASIESLIKNNNVPQDIATRAQNASEAQQGEIIREWFNKELESDPAAKAAREEYMATTDVVPISIAAGSVKLRRAQAMSGPARDAMLQDAERMFLAIRGAAEGQPEFQLGLGEIYARLGKVAESEAEFAALLKSGDNRMGLAVAQVYRNIGSVERSKKVATDVYARGDTAIKYDAAILLSMLSQQTDEDEAEKWMRKADPNSTFVKTSLLELEGTKARREGKDAECVAKFAAAAKLHLANATATDVAGFNNAAIAHQQRFICSGDLQAVVDAQAAFERAYRARSDAPIVVGNLASVLRTSGELKVLGKRVDVRVLRPDSGETESLISALLDGPDRDAVLAELAADPSIRRSRELYAQFEVLAPSNTGAYERQFADAYDRRDEAAAKTVVDNARRAKALDVSDSKATRDKWKAGELDAKLFETTAQVIARREAILARKLDPKTRAAALLLQTSSRGPIALYKPDVSEFARMRQSALEASKLWPALGTSPGLASNLIDEAAMTADATAWSALRRERGAIAALAKLDADGSPIAAKIKSSKQWSEVPGFARADTSRPGVDDLRLARLLGDAQLETRAKAVLDDKLTRLSLELASVVSPGSLSTTEDLAYLDKR